MQIYPNMKRHIVLTAIFVFAISVVGGCLGPIKTVPTKRYAVLPEIQVEPVASTGKTLGVRALEPARPYRQRIVFRDAGFAVGEYREAEWAELPADIVTLALVDAITATKKFQDVGNATSMNAPDFILTGQLRKFDEVRTTQPWTAECEVRLALRPTFGTGEVWSGVMTAKAPLDRNEVSALPAAMSKVVADVVQQAASQIAAQTLPEKQEEE